MSWYSTDQIQFQRATDSGVRTQLEYAVKKIAMKADALKVAVAENTN